MVVVYNYSHYLSPHLLWYCNNSWFSKIFITLLPVTLMKQIATMKRKILRKSFCGPENGKSTKKIPDRHTVQFLWLCNKSNYFMWNYRFTYKYLMYLCLNVKCFRQEFRIFFYKKLFFTFYMKIFNLFLETEFLF